MSTVGEGSAAAAAAAGVLVGDMLLTVNDAFVGVTTEVLALPFTFEREGSAKVFTIAVQCISVLTGQSLGVPASPRQVVSF